MIYDQCPTHRLVALRNFVEIYLSRARDLAKEGRKDEARDWWRFFENSCVVDVLETSGVLSIGECEHIKRSLATLKTECHPLDVPDYRTDLQAIREALARIEDKISPAVYADSLRQYRVTAEGEAFTRKRVGNYVEH